MLATVTSVAFVHWWSLPQSLSECPSISQPRSGSALQSICSEKGVTSAKK